MARKQTKPVTGTKADEAAKATLATGENLPGGYAYHPAAGVVRIGADADASAVADELNAEGREWPQADGEGGGDAGD